MVRGPGSIGQFGARLERHEYMDFLSSSGPITHSNSELSFDWIGKG